MNDSQIIAIALIFVAAIGSILYNNSRITDLRTDTSKGFLDLRADLGARLTDTNKRIDDLRDSVTRHIDDKFALLGQQMKTMGDNIMRILGEHETRIHKLEHPQ